MLKSPKLWVLGAGVGLIGAFGANHRLVQRERKELRKHVKNAEVPVLELQNSQLVRYPWEPDFHAKKGPEDWEFRKVKVRGALFGHFHLVYRERNGVEGYLVFKGIKTANGLQPELLTTGEASAPPVGMMVKLGWISAKNVEKLPTEEVNFITKVEPDTSLPGVTPQVFNPYTGFMYNTEGENLEYPIEGNTETEVEITGFLRKGEQESWLAGRRRFYNNQTTTVIDLERMASFYHFRNVFPATHYYLEAAVHDPKNRAEKENKIIPAKLNDPLAAPEAETYNAAANGSRNAKIATAILTGLGVALL